MLLFTDGASRGNPGESGIGFVCYDNDIIITEKSFYLGKYTNNVAEICAILVSLYILQEKSIVKKKTTIYSDSLLIINQFNKIFKVRDKRLLEAHKIFRENFLKLPLTFVYIPRNKNKIADTLANKGIDEKIPLSQDILTLLSPILL